ncbi:MAG: hypothetical protein FWG19_03230 [Methanomassiliicoccaceae archaeon]|nr:hypothetical protein [Methanomassiliicoccaceae archaeon]
MKPNEFAEIATHYEWNTKHPKCDDKELKFRSSSDAVRKAVLTEIASLDPEIYISTDERKGIDTGHPKRYKDLFRKVAEYILNDTEEPDEEFFMDGSSFMKPKSGEDIVKTAVKIKGIRYHHAESVNELIVQTQDFIAGAANASRKGNDAYIDIIKGSIIFWRID